MTNDDLIFRHRLQLFARAQQVGVRRACRELGFHHSTYYRWKPLVARHGLEILRPRERRPPRMPNQIPTWLEEQILALALAQPGLGPRRLAAQLRLARFGGERVSATGVHNVLRRRGLSTRRKRLALVAGYAAPPEPERLPRPEPHIEAARPGEVLQLDCFYLGRLEGSRGRSWQYTATDVVSGFLWAKLHNTPQNPAPRFTVPLLRAAASELAQAGHRLGAVTTDRGSEFVAEAFRTAVAALGAEHRLVRRPESNGCVERVQRTILEECWRPSFARSMIPSFNALREDLADYVRFYNFERAHTGRHTAGRTPAEVVYGARKVRPR